MELKGKDTDIIVITFLLISLLLLFKHYIEITFILDALSSTFAVTTVYDKSSMHIA